MLQEFLYVDIARVRSLLSQLDKGVLDSAVESKSKKSGFDLGSVFQTSGLWTRENEAAAESSRSMQELLYTMFEEAASSEGFVHELDAAQLCEVDNWYDGVIHAGLKDGQIIKVFTDISIVDSAFVKSRLARLERLDDAIVAMNKPQIEAQVQALRSAMEAQIEEGKSAAQASGKPRDVIKRLEPEIRSTVNAQIQTLEVQIVAGSGFIDETVRSIMRVINEFLQSEALSLRCMGIDEDHADCAFVGSLLTRDNYIQKERDALFSRYGSQLKGWTAVLQIASIPEATASQEVLMGELESLSSSLTRDGGGFNPGALEQVTMKLLSVFDALGVSDGPRWPTVSVIPLAVYRTVPGEIPVSN